MLNKSKDLALNFKILRFFLISPILFLTPFFNNIQEAKAGLEFQWDQDSGYRRLKWFQKENRRKFKNTIYFFLRPNDRRSDLLKLSINIPKNYKVDLDDKKISFCKVLIGGFENRTKCLEDIPADFEISKDESSLRKLNIYPYSPIPYSKESYAFVIKANNPIRSGLYQFHSFGQPKGKTISTYIGSWTIVID